MAKRGRGDGGTIVIRRIEEGGHGHHGGAWKVAYADFVTAMMAFFLLMWLLNATTDEQRRGIADYFSPSVALASGQAGSGQPFGGSTPHSAGNMSQDSGTIRVERGPRPILLLETEEEDDSERRAQPVHRLDGPDGEEDRQIQRIIDAIPGETQGPRAPTGGEGPTMLRSIATAGEEDAERQAREAQASRAEEAKFEEMLHGLRETFQADPALAALAQHVMVEVAPEGLRIQLVDTEGKPLFASGSATPNENARRLLREVAQAAARLPNPVQVAGHTDAAPFRGAGRSNWELSSERANAARRMLGDGGLPEARIQSVVGLAEREPLFPGQPLAAGNRRVAVTLLRQAAAP
ncbi:flagellar motor protein MotB [Roseococcus sp. YIM B11640]|uniref:flagellar motor protein MotB n=1 Tax=Roseococcus sp. YIM B11640 TaxID=3133973 RepID=UPI003C7D14EE